MKIPTPVCADIMSKIKELSTLHAIALFYDISEMKIYEYETYFFACFR